MASARPKNRMPSYDDLRGELVSARVLDRERMKTIGSLRFDLREARAKINVLEATLNAKVPSSFHRGHSVRGRDAAVAQPAAHVDE